MGAPTTTTSNNQLNISSTESGTFKNYENLNVVDPTIASKVTYIYHMSEIQQNRCRGAYCHFRNYDRNHIWCSFRFCFPKQ